MSLSSQGIYAAPAYGLALLRLPAFQTVLDPVTLIRCERRVGCQRVEELSSADIVELADIPQPKYMHRGFFGLGRLYHEWNQAIEVLRKIESSHVCLIQDPLEVCEIAPSLEG